MVTVPSEASWYKPESRGAMSRVAADIRNREAEVSEEELQPMMERSDRRGMMGLR
ncbi:MAG: hypothetical protein HY046_08360 [Acidobacteria bacterium]|nr:hypothetical protein [Acidobacteriota bacterium]